MKYRNKDLTRAREDYLETILVLSGKEAGIRPIDIAKFKKVSKATVSATLSALRDSGYLYYDECRTIRFTAKGRRAAEAVLRKHNVLFRFLTLHLGVPRAAAQEAACKMEHSIDLEIAKKLSSFIEGLDGNPAHPGNSTERSRPQSRPCGVGKIFLKKS